MKQTHIITFTLAIALLISSCEGQQEDPKFDYNAKSAKVVNTNNNFGLQLFRQVYADEDQANIMISPTSVSLALGMTYNGAEGSTQEAFEALFDYQGLSREEINRINRELIDVLTTNSKGNLVEIANSIWYRKGFPVREDFIGDNRTYFDAEVRDLDFARSDAVDIINGWVSDRTHEKIPDIINEISAETMMILINALYFNCLWETEFDPEDSFRSPFHREDGSKYADVDMMKLRHRIPTFRNEDFAAAELPYRNGKFSMYLLLPSPGSTVADLLKKLDGESWNSWVESFVPVEKFELYMPKFKFDFKRSLKNDLEEMGLGEAFTPAANFSRISDIDLMISDVIHKTYIDVNEEGTEAAAVTAVVMETTSIGPPKMLFLDRPFVFLITENSSRSILFSGVVAEPSYED